MTSAAADTAGLFGWGELRHTLAGTALKDLARACGQDVITLEQALVVLDDPLLAPGLDEAFFALLGEDIEREDHLDYAELAFHAVHTRVSQHARRVLERLLELAASDPLTAENYARVGLEELADEDSPLFAARCQEALGQALAARGDFATAASVLTDGADRARAAEETRVECDMLGAATACRQMLDDQLRALSLAKRWVAIARALGDPGRLAHSLGQRGNAQMALGRYEAARADFEEALPAAVEAGDEQTQSNWLGNLANLAVIDGDYDEAIRLHSAALELSRRLGNLESMEQDLGHLAQVCWLTEAWDDALQYQREAVAVAAQRADPARVTATRAVLRRMYSELGRHEHASALERLEEPDPESDFAKEDEPSATTGAFVRPPEDPELDAELDAAQREGRPEALMVVLEARVALDPANPLLHVKRGIVLAALQRWDPALEAYEEAIRLAPRWLVPHVNAINVWEGRHDLDTPRARYERMAADDPFDPLPRTVLGRIYGCEARHDEAVRELREALRLAPGTFDITWELALELDEMAREQLTEDWFAAWATFEECMLLLEELPRLNPEGRPRALANAGRIYIRMAEESTRASPPIMGGWLGDRELDLWVRAIINLTEAAPALTADWPQRALSYATGLLVNMQDAVVSAEAGKAFDRYGHQDLAVWMLETSVAINPNPPEPRFQLARLLADRPGERARAIELLESVTREASDHVDARGLLTRLRREGAP
jgi:tetratricopeptide (TPR) repeat protein